MLLKSNAVEDAQLSNMKKNHNTQDEGFKTKWKKVDKIKNIIS